MKKEAFSYSTFKEVHQLATERAVKEGTNLSKVIHTFLTEYGGSVSVDKTQPDDTAGKEKPSDKR